MPHNDGSPRKAADPPTLVELAERVTEAGPSRPVGDRASRGGHRRIGVVRRQRARDPGEPGADRERLHARLPGEELVQEGPRSGAGDLAQLGFSHRKRQDHFDHTGRDRPRPFYPKFCG